MAAPTDLDPSTYEHIELEIADGIATIWMNRPDKMNAFTELMRYEIIDALDHTDADDDVRAVIFTGRGRAFCAGADLSSGEGTFSRGGSDIMGRNGVPRDGGGTVSLRIYDSKKPVIGAINGAAVGVGVTMTLPMDIRLASTAAKFGFVFSRRGIVPEAASSWFLPRLVGISQAMEWVASGEVFPAEEAMAGGLVRSVHKPDDLLPAAYALARRLTESSSAVSIAVARKMMWRMLGADHPMAAHKVDSRGILERGRSEDVKEGINSFFEKRAPQFPDKVSDGLGTIFSDWHDPTYDS
ncbi:MAG: crotonase/enoyl-CoA hydratase family protein [Actinomycetota bacterium]|jgi:enoyl-CoA hydratase/carnithine racemase|nr:enoyl-CoA hydratase [Acidimicrobiaceae bacterium]MEC7665409.1 crotonase/enoyl-CoA hydratase family protein [Actinomycetota bacterium]MEC8018251.1 crotonase/enoyl-CoA hydratase family protein [Actinomycetota bacterium]MEC8464484.1 crotonase/enoyl-CoA hydratase family protein [Actinomycetota bacterium]MEC8503826.1 crotonase/enoyl-CoA hydratase family protein [Actinomycetota bacterium]